MLGQDGNDTLVDGNGAQRRETYLGGAGTDMAAYALATTPVSLTLDGAVNDGEAGEGDMLATSRTSSGLAGNDRIDPLAGGDSAFGGDGDDLVNVRDGVQDVARGSAAADTITRDPIDGAVA